MEIFDNSKDSYDFDKIKKKLYSNVSWLNVGGGEIKTYRDNDETYSQYYIQHYPEMEKKLSVNFVRNHGETNVDSIRKVVVFLKDESQKKDYRNQHVIILDKDKVTIETRRTQLTEFSKAIGHESLESVFEEMSRGMEKEERDKRVDYIFPEEEEIAYKDISAYLEKDDKDFKKLWDLINNNKLFFGFGNQSSNKNYGDDLTGKHH